MKKKYEITNMVASADLGMDLDLYVISSKFKNIEYEPEQFPGAIMKFNEPKATILVFKNGKLVIVGCRDRKTIEKAIVKAYKSLKKYAKNIRKKFDPNKPAYELTNMVASADLELDLDLFRVAMELTDIEYEPEQFPGAIVKLRKPNVSLLLFKNGKLIIAGGRTRKEIEAAIDAIYKRIKRFNKKR